MKDKEFDEDGIESYDENNVLEEDEEVCCFQIL